MNATQRGQEIKNRSESADERTVRLWCKDRWRDFPVMRVPVDALLLNVDNRRFAAERTLMESKLGHSLDPENSEDDEISVISILLDNGHDVDGNLVKGAPSKDYEGLKTDWLRRKQASPLLDSAGRIRAQWQQTACYAQAAQETMALQVQSGSKL